MAQRRSGLDKPPDLTRLLARAGRRFTLPTCKLLVTYASDVDTLYIRLSKNPRPTRSDDDMERGLVFDYEGKKLVGIEVLNISD